MAAMMPEEMPIPTRYRRAFGDRLSSVRLRPL
jgi:hypothetical protein